MAVSAYSTRDFGDDFACGGDFKCICAFYGGGGVVCPALFIQGEFNQIFKIFEREKSMTTQTLDTTGLNCPEPVMLLHQAIRRMQSGDVLNMTATDPASSRDVPNFCRHLGHTLIDSYQDGDVYYYTIQKK